MNSSFRPAFSTLRPNDAIASAVRAVSWIGDDEEAARQEHQAAEPDLRRDDERRPVAAGDQVGEHAEPDHRQRPRADQRRLA